MKPGLAILQNMYVRDPERLKRSFARADSEGYGEELRRRTIAYSLFAGCLTGRRLKAAFGEDLLAQIVWEESTREIAGDPKTIFPPDLAHLEKIIREYQPKAILAFGKIAGCAVTEVLANGNLGPTWLGAETRPTLITAPHPAARQPEVPTLLRQAAEKFRKCL